MLTPKGRYIVAFVWMATLLIPFRICAQTPAPADPVKGIIQLFDTYRIVMFGEIHECRQQYDVLRQLVAAPGFAERVNDIVIDGNARYQNVVDRYIGGENVPSEQVQRAIYPYRILAAGLPEPGSKLQTPISISGPETSSLS
jgi:hypothetical protein